MPSSRSWTTALISLLHTGPSIIPTVHAQGPAKFIRYLFPFRVICFGVVIGLIFCCWVCRCSCSVLSWHGIYICCLVFWCFITSLVDGRFGCIKPLFSWDLVVVAPLDTFGMLGWQRKVTHKWNLNDLHCWVSLAFSWRFIMPFSKAALLDLCRLKLSRFVSCSYRQQDAAFGLFSQVVHKAKPAPSLHRKWVRVEE
jgi:hypothetical protein